MVASGDLADGPDKRVGASADDIDAINENIDPTIEKAGAIKKHEE